MANCPEFLFFRQLAIQKLCLDLEHAEMFAQAVTGCTSADDDGGDTGNGGGSGNDTDEKVKVTSNDINSSYLFNKIVGTGAIDITQINDGGDESLGIGHEDTSSVTNIDTNGAQVIDTLIFDTYGHVIGYTLRDIEISDEMFENFFSVQDTETVDLTFSGGILSADIIVSPQSNNLITALSDGIFAANLLANDLIFGGVVSWIEDYDFNVSPSQYVLNHVTYNIPVNTVVTLDPADPVLDRFDVIYLDDTGNVGVLTGTPSLTPAQPGLDLGTQIGVGVVFVQAGSTQPVLLVQECITENVTWTPTVSDASINASSAVTPCTGGTSVEATSSSTGDYIKFIRGSAFSPLEEMNVVKFQVKPKLDWNDNTINKLKFTFRLSGVIVGNEVILEAANIYGFDYNSLACQLVSLNIFSFNLLPSDLVDEFRIEVESGVPFGWFIDELCLQGGLGTGGNTDDGDFIWNQYFGAQTPGRYWIKGDARAEGWFTSPDMITGGDGSEKFGWGSRVTGTTGTAIGYLAQANGQEGATAVGNQAVANIGVAVGFGARSNRGVAIGGSQLASGGVAVGLGSSSTANAAVAIGDNTAASGLSGVALGSGSINSGHFSTLLGANSTVAHSYSLALGVTTETTADHQVVIGGYDLFSDYGFDSLYFGTGVTSPFNANRFWTVTGAQGTNISGTTWTFAGAKGTGNALSGTFEWQTADPTGSGTSLQSLTTKMGLNSNTKGLYLTNSRFQATEGADVTAANNLTLGTGNSFTINGNTQINAITSTNWQDGAQIHLHLTGTPTLKHNTAGGAGTTPLRLAGAVDFVIAGYTVLELELKDNFWNEVGRTVATGGGSGLVTVDNALTLSTPTNAQWGGTLVHSTTIVQANFPVQFTNGGGKTFLSDPVDQVYQFGDIDSVLLGSAITIDDAQQRFLFASNGERFLDVNKSTDKYEIGQIDGTNYFSIDAVADTQRVYGSRFETALGAEVIAANDLTLSTDGNVIPITGNTQINTITTTNWQAGSFAFLEFVGTPLVKNNQVAGGSTAPIILNGGIDFQVAAGDTLAVFYDGISWHEIGRKSTATGSTGILSADNGLSLSSATNVQLGATASGANSPLLHNTFINTGASNYLEINGTNTYSLRVVNSGGNFGFYSSIGDGGIAVSGVGTASGIGVDGSSGTAEAIRGTSGSGTAISGSSTSGLGALLAINPSSTNTVVEVMQLTRSSSGTPADGEGQSIGFYNETSTTIANPSNSIISKLTTVNNATRTSQFIVTGVNSAVTADLLTLSGSGALKMNKYGVGSFTAGTATYLIATDASGNWFEYPSGGLAGGLITADNGLTMSTATNVQLGGTLIKNTTISSATASFRLTISGVNTFAEGAMLDVITSGNVGFAIRGETTNGRGLFGTETAGGIAVYGSSTGGGNALFGTANSTGVALYGQAVDGVALETHVQPASTNTVVPIGTFSRESSGTAADGIGGSMDFYINTTTGSQLANQIIAKYTTAANASYASSLIFKAAFGATGVDVLTLAGDGSVKLRPITATAASAITPAEGMIVMVSDTNGTFTSIGFWGYSNGAWAKF